MTELKLIPACSKPLLDAVFGNSELEILKLADESVDIICIDPPYLYLKNQKLEREFNEKLFFEQCKRVLTKDGIIILFGRGVSFYRWNCILDNLGFVFKEEIIWDKGYTTSPVIPISRHHETISIFCKGKAKIKKVKIPYLEQKKHNIPQIYDDLKRLISALNNPISLNRIKDFLENNNRGFDITRNCSKHLVTFGSKRLGSQDVNTMNSIEIGMNEKSIIKILSDRYSSIHPTQKPVRLLERLIQLCLPDKQKEEILVVDFFAGSFSCGEACFNLGVNFKGFEIDEEYYNYGVERLRKIKFQTSLF